MKKLLSMLLAVCMVFSLAACGGNSGTPSSSNGSNGAGGEGVTSGTAEPISIRIGHIQNEENAFHLACLQFKEYLETNSPVPVTVEIYPNGQLGGERELAEALQLGSLEMAVAPGAIASFAPEQAVIGLPYLFQSREHAYAVLDGDIGDDLAASLPSQGLRLLTYWENGFRQITNSKRPINTPADLQGIKIRTPEDPVYVAAFSSWGANVTAMAWSEVFTALQMGSIDAQENALSIAVTNSLWEVQDYLSISNHIYGACQILMSEAFWQSLSPEVQKVVQEAADYSRDWEREFLKEQDDTYLKTLSDNGMAVNYVDTDAFVQASQPIWEHYRDQFGEYIDRIQEVAQNMG